MLKFIVFCFAIAAVIFSVTSQTDSNIGPGRWQVINIAKCHDDESYEHRFDIQRRRLNRTHDKYNACMNLSVPMDDTFGVRLEICQHVDGGCKPIQTLTDNSLPEFAYRFAKDNVKDCLDKCGVPGGEFPIPEGDWCFENFIFNYCELPAESMYGTFDGVAYLVKGTTNVACVQTSFKFTESDDDSRCE